jgi:hypothetical protein
LLERLERRPHPRREPALRAPALRSRTSATRGRPLDQHRVLDPDPAIRLHVLRTLMRSPDAGLAGGSMKALLTTALGAEIVGFAMLVESPCPGADSDADHRLQGLETIERISRLLFLINPDRYPGCLLSALQCGNGATEAAALEYLDNTLASPHRQLLISFLDRWTLAAA